MPLWKVSMSTKKQKQVLQHIKDHKQKEGIKPTLKQIAQYMDLSSVSNVYVHINALIDQGKLLKSDDHSSYDIPENNDDMNKVVREAGRLLRPGGVGSKNMRTLDLFAGIGGIRLGFERAGFKTVFANDFEKACQRTYDANFTEAKLQVEDITKIVARDLPEFDFLLAGFPCQAFSIAGYRQGFKDEKGRGNLFFDIARILEVRQPDGFLLENVKNLKTHDGGNTYKVIEKTLNDLGYTVRTKVLNSMEYGNVPQNRERIYIVGFKDHVKTEAFEFPAPTKLTKSVVDILEKAVDSKYYYTGKPLHEKLVDDVTELGAVYQWRRKYVRKNKKGVCPTLTANMGMGGHNVPIIYDGKGIRKLTPRECARLQGYPDTYILPDLADSTLYKQLGNSVTVPVLERIAKNMQVVL